MIRKLAYVAVAALALAGFAGAVVLSNGDTVVSVCASATATAPGYTNADHIFSDNGAPVYTLPGSSSPGTSDTKTNCVTTTVSPQTVTVTTAGTTTTTPPPPSKLHFKGPVLFRYADSYGPVQTTAGQGYDRNGVVVVGYGDDWKVSQLPTAKGLTYKTMLEVFDCASSDACLSGVSKTDALAANVLLKDSSGNLLGANCTGACGGSSYVLGDLGSSAYQNLWVQKVSARLAAQHLDGVYIDNVACDNFSGSATSAKYPTAASWRAAALSFVQNVGAQMQAQGYYVLTGTGCYGSAGNDYPAADSWWTDVAPNVNGLLSETFEQNPQGTGHWYEVRYNAPTLSWLGDWLGRRDVIRIAQDAGSDAWEITSNVDISTAAGKTVAKYACGTFLLDWNGTSGGCGVNTGGPAGVDTYDATGWAYPIGTPTGAVTQQGVGFYRTYTGGKVIVNPDPSASVTILGVTLAPKTAYIGA